MTAARNCFLPLLLATVALWGQSPPSAAGHDQIVEWFRAGQQAQAEGKLALAAGAYEKVIQARPEIAEAHSNLGVVYYMQARYADALASFDRARARKPGLFVAVVLSGASHAKMRRFEKAIPLLEKALHERPDDFQALLYLGLSHAALGRELEASRYLEKLADLHPGDPEALYHLGVSFLQLSIDSYEAVRTDERSEFLYFRALASLDESQGKPLADVRARYERAIEARPDYPGLHWDLARWLIRHNDTAGAVTALSREIELQPHNPAVPLLLADLYRRQGDAARGGDLLSRAESVLAGFPASDQELAAVLERDPPRGLSLLDGLLRMSELEIEGLDATKFPPPAQLQRSLQRLSTALFAQQQPDWALDVYIRARVEQGNLRLARDQLLELASRSPDWATPSYLLGNLYRRLSVAAHEKLVLADPNGYRTHLLKGDALESQYKDEEAIEAYRQAIRTQPLAPLAHYRLGILLGRKRQFDEAVQALRQELEIDPYNAQAKVRLAEIHNYRRQPDEAIPALQRAIKEDGGIASAYHALGRAYLLKADVEKAVPMLERGVELSPDNRNAHYQLARAYQQLGRRQEAAREFQLFRDLGNKPSIARSEALVDAETSADTSLPDVGEPEPRSTEKN